MRTIQLLFLIFSLGAVMKAQQSPPVAPATPAPQAANPAPPPPAPEMIKLSKLLVGKWRTHETFAVKGAASNGAQQGKGVGVDVIRAGPGGYTLLSDYHSRGSNGKFAGFGMFVWDSAAQRYQLYWMDNMSPAVLLLNGKWERNNLVLTADTTTPAGATLYIKQTYSAITKNSLTFLQQSSLQGGPLQQDSLVKLTRIAGPGRVHRKKK